MEAEQNHDLLDRALRSYASLESRAGLEQRVLSRVASVRPWSKWFSPAWSLVAAAVVGGIVLMSRPRLSEPVRVPVRRTIVATVTPRQPVPVRVPERKRDAYRSAAPLTREERAWISLADAGVLAAEPAGIEPIRIDELNIPPLETEGGE